MLRLTHSLHLEQRKSKIFRDAPIKAWIRTGSLVMQRWDIHGHDRFLALGCLQASVADCGVLRMSFSIRSLTAFYHDTRVDGPCKSLSHQRE